MKDQKSISNAATEKKIIIAIPKMEGNKNNIRKNEFKARVQCKIIYWVLEHQMKLK